MANFEKSRYSENMDTKLDTILVSGKKIRNKLNLLQIMQLRRLAVVDAFFNGRQPALLSGY